MNEFRISPVDPVDNSVTEYYTYVSESYATATGTQKQVPDLIIPSANFPVNNPVRYLIELPAEAVIDDTIWDVVNVDTATTLIRVPPNAELVANTYKIFPSTSKRRNVIEIHVGASSSNVGDVIKFKGKFESSVLPFLGSNGYQFSGYDYVIASSDSSERDRARATNIISVDADAGDYINNLMANTVSFLILDGTYNLTTGIDINANDVLFDSRNNAVFYALTAGMSMIDLQGALRCKIYNIKLYGEDLAAKGVVDQNDTGNDAQNTFYGIYVQECTNTTGAGFYYVHNAEKCIATACTDGFNSCNTIINCIAYNNDESGFSACRISSNCISYLNTEYGYVACTQLVCCYAEDNTLDGFQNCTHCTTCRSYSNSGDGFDSCSRCISCESLSNTGYGFNNCDAITMNVTASSNTAGKYNDSYYSNTANATYAAATTLNGGWNN